MPREIQTLQRDYRGGALTSLSFNYYYSVIVPGPGVQSAKQLDPAMPQREWRQEVQAVGSPGRQDGRAGSCPSPSGPRLCRLRLFHLPCGAKISLLGVRLGISLLPEPSLPVH